MLPLKALIWMAWGGAQQSVYLESTPDDPDNSKVQEPLA